MHLHPICGIQLVTDLQLIPLNTLFPPQFISVLKVLRLLIAPEPPNTLQLKLSCVSDSSLCCHCQIAPSLCWWSLTTGQFRTPKLITWAYRMSFVAVIEDEEQHRPFCWFTTAWEPEVPSELPNQRRSSCQGSRTRIERGEFTAH